MLQISLAIFSQKLSKPFFTKHVSTNGVNNSRADYKKKNPTLNGCESYCFALDI